MYIPFNDKQVFGLTAKTLTKRMKNYYQDQRFDETIYLQLLKCFQLRARLSQAVEFPDACFQVELTQIYQKEKWSLWQLRFFGDLKHFFSLHQWLLLKRRYLAKVRHLGFVILYRLKKNENVKNDAVIKILKMANTIFNVRVLVDLKKKLKSLFENKLNNSH
ncbi:hypothetical protein [Enterococcus dispar]|uniref:hypothetical protein n=1 Tax=Enterococcus dispar TaxID=44009 RepID=UPI00288E931C|nr:hypothetical protein [Enterococcus dispar]MDT2705997.1 hypothetical protein [Enterococcus dispar]